MLYVIPSPIGHLGDLTYRAVEVLKTVDLLLAEDTRQAGKLLKHYGIEVNLFPFHMRNEHGVLDQVVEKLRAGMQLGMISDAGMPGISDPGFLLVRACVAENIEVVALPGPSAFLPALVASGLPCDRFYFEGFLPHKKGRNTRLEVLASMDCTLVLYESPHRIHKTVRQLCEQLGAERPACLSREISKMHEEHIRLPLEEMQRELDQRGKIKGEITLVIGPPQ